MKNFFASLFKKESPYSKVTSIILVIVLIVIAFFSFYPLVKKVVNKKEAITISEDFINEYLMQPGSKASVVDINSEYGLYKLQIDIGSGVVDSYLTKDGKLFFPQALDIKKINEENTDVPEEAATLAEVTNKNDKPVVELFVMSHCPYGTQMEKAILPVVKALGNNIDFQLKFNSYVMHGEKEIIEEINQYCLMEEQPALFNDYLECFLAAGDSEACLTSTNVDTTKLKTCFDKTEKDNNILADFKNNKNYQGDYPSFSLQKEDNELYGVGGSPTLIINGQEIRADRNPASLLYTICSGFNTQPDECFASIPSVSPAPGFGTDTTTAGTAAECQ